MAAHSQWPLGVVFDVNYFIANDNVKPAHETKKEIMHWNYNGTQNADRQEFGNI